MQKFQEEETDLKNIIYILIRTDNSIYIYIYIYFKFIYIFNHIKILKNIYNSRILLIFFKYFNFKFFYRIV